jgi:hypothetical protein
MPSLVEGKFHRNVETEGYARHFKSHLNFINEKLDNLKQA